MYCFWQISHVRLEALEVPTWLIKYYQILLTGATMLLSAYWHCKGIMRIWMYYYIVLLLSTANLLRIYCAWRYSMDLHVLISNFHISMTAPLHSAGSLASGQVKDVQLACQCTTQRKRSAPVAPVAPGKWIWWYGAKTVQNLAVGSVGSVGSTRSLWRVARTSLWMLRGKGTKS